MRKFSTFLVLLFFICKSFSQGTVDGFMKEKGQTDISLAYTYENYNLYFADSDLEIARTVQSVSLYGVHGITDWLNIITSVPYVNNTGEANVQDGTGMVRFRPLELEKENFKFSFIGALGYSLPLSNYQTESAFAIGQQAEAILARGIIAMKWKSGWFLQLQSGYTWRSSPTPSSFPVITKLGHASSMNYFDLWFHKQEAQGGFDYRDGYDQPFSSFGVSYSKVGATYFRSFKPWVGFFVQGAYTINGRNVGQAIGASAGFTFRFYRLNLLKDQER